MLALIDAAVLVPIIAHTEGATILLTRRADHLRHHPGQISFPGGRQERTDVDAVATALREMEEELNISAEKVNVIGCLDRHITGTGFQITPVVGLIKPPTELRLDRDEVAEVFEIPLDYALNEAHYSLTRVKRGAQLHRYFVLYYENRRIWGATAGILHTLIKELRINIEFERYLKGLS